MASVDHVLKLYTKILDSPYLHYGYWDEGQTASYEDFSLAQLVAAQERYVENLAGHIPSRRFSSRISLRNCGSACRSPNHATRTRHHSRPL